MRERETLGSRLGFLLLSAGCAIGLGNVWRFPFIAGKYGGAAFVLIYILFLIAFGLPIMVAEFSVGRASRKSVASGFKVLEPKGSKWHYFSYLAIAGNYILMMFYTTVCGWMFYYFYSFTSGKMDGMDSQQVGEYFGTFLGNPQLQVLFMIIVCVMGFGVCFIGLRNGVERFTKFIMLGLLAVIMVLVGKALSLPGASEGLKFYLKPDFSHLIENGLWEAIYAAMGQAFFTLSVGIGSMMIFGSYIDKKNSLSGESARIVVLDTFVAIMSGLIIFPACFSFGVNPGAGPGLIFVTLPNIFNSMNSGSFWGGLFFLFMSFAAFTTILAVFENIVAFLIDFGLSRKVSVLINLVILPLLSLPCALGFNVWSGFQPMGPGSGVLDLEDFLLSNNILPIGSLIFIIFCCAKSGWGWKNFIKEANTGKGIKLSDGNLLKNYLLIGLSLVILVIFITGYYNIFGK